MSTPISSTSVLRVNFSINLRNVLEVNEVAETVSVETTVRMFWYDSRVELLNGSLPLPSGGTCSPRRFLRWR